MALQAYESLKLKLEARNHKPQIPTTTVGIHRSRSWGCSVLGFGVRGKGFGCWGMGFRGLGFIGVVYAWGRFLGVGLRIEGLSGQAFEDFSG